MKQVYIIFDYYTGNNYVDSTWTNKKRAYSRLKTKLREFFNDEDFKGEEICKVAKSKLKHTLTEETLEEIYSIADELDLNSYPLRESLYIMTMPINKINQ